MKITLILLLLKIFILLINIFLINKFKIDLILILKVVLIYSGKTIKSIVYDHSLCLLIRVKTNS